MQVLTHQSVKQEWSVQLSQLSNDMRRILRIQWREFINEIIDAEREMQTGKVIPMPLPRYLRARTA